MRVFLNMLLIAISVVMVIGIISTVAHCQEYTYDGELSPNDVFGEYQTVKAFPTRSGLIVVERKRVDDGFPRAVIALLRPVKGGVHLFCYAYIGKNAKLWNVKVEDGHYKETPLDPQIEKEVRNVLFKLLGILDS